LLETGDNTGKYRGTFTIADRTHSGYHWINASEGGWVEISSIMDPEVQINLSIGSGIHIEPKVTLFRMNEDDNLSLHFNAIGVRAESWILKTNALWLSWNESSNHLGGIPNNQHVGEYWVNLRVEGHSYSDEINFTVIVYNTWPEISLPDRYYVYEDEELLLDLNSTDEGEGNAVWSINTDAAWLNQNATSGLLYGTPTNLDVGMYQIKVSFDDGNGGMDVLNFNFEVLNTPPLITTQDIEEIQQDEEYHNDYNSTDDGHGTITWYLYTDATWLSIDASTGVLNGTPSNADVGTYQVNVSVSDGNNGRDHTDFALRVRDIDDPPILFGGNFSPANGTTSTDFTFSIIYRDMDGDEPLNISLVVDGHWYALMNNGSEPPDFRKGVRYCATLKLTKGVHRYHFYASDGNANVQFPHDGYLTIPHIRHSPWNDTEIDADGDGYNDTYEYLTGSDPLDPLSTPFDIDGDGWNDTIENMVGTDPYSKKSVPPDRDGDGLPDALDPDRDGDGVPNEVDAYPDDSKRWEDDVAIEKEYGVVWVVGVVVIVVVVVTGIIAGVVLVRKRRGAGVREKGGSGEDEVRRVGEDMKKV